MNAALRSQIAALQIRHCLISYWFDNFRSHPSRLRWQSGATLISRSKFRALPLGR
jgi:hypothetical protein